MTIRGLETLKYGHQVEIKPIEKKNYPFFDDMNQ